MISELLRQRLVKRTITVIIISIVVIAGVFLVDNFSGNNVADNNAVYALSGSFPDKIVINSLDSNFQQSYNKFAVEMFNQAFDDNKVANSNIFISPASIYLALGMTYNGASGNTATQMAQALQLKDITLEQFNKDCKLFQYVIKGNDKSDVLLSNSIWIKDSFYNNVAPQFLENDSKYFGAAFNTLNSNSSTNSTDIINGWVEKNTKGLIKKAVDEIREDTVMVLANSIYFKGEWKDAFTTTTDGFFTTSDVKKKAKMMRNTFMKASYIDNELVQGIKLPYKDGRTSMVILLPKKTLVDLKPTLSDNKSKWVQDLINGGDSRQINIHLVLPKFKIEYYKEIDEYLKKMGMIDAFSPTKADFSQMTKVDKENNLCIGSVTHASFLEVNEKGTEAAASTVVTMKRGGVDPNAPKTTPMVVDKPFVAAIIDDKTGTILFMGAINDPG